MPLTEQERRENKRQKDAAYYAQNRERIKAQSANYHIRTRDVRLAHQKVYRERHQDKTRATILAWEKDNPEKVKESRRKYCATHRQLINSRQNAWRKTRIEPEASIKNRKATKRRKYILNKEKLKEGYRLYRIKNRERIKSYLKDYAIRNKEQRKEYVKKWRNSPNGKAYLKAVFARRRALKLAATVNLKQIQAWLKSVHSKPTRCYYCNVLVPPTQIHVDHIVSLTKGGAHSIENLCVACASCNCSKGAKPIRAWVKMGQQILEL